MRPSGQSRVERKAEKFITQTMPPLTRSGIPRLEWIPDRRKYSSSPTASGGRASSDRTRKIFPARSWPRYQLKKAGAGPGGYGSTRSLATEHKIVAQPSAVNSPKVPRSKSRNWRSCLSALSISVSSLSPETLAKREESQASRRSNARSSSRDASGHRQLPLPLRCKSQRSSAHTRALFFQKMFMVVSCFDALLPNKAPANGETPQPDQRRPPRLA